MIEIAARHRIGRYGQLLEGRREPRREKCAEHQCQQRHERECDRSRARDALERLDVRTEWRREGQIDLRIREGAMHGEPVDIHRREAVPAED